MLSEILLLNTRLRKVTQLIFLKLAVFPLIICTLPVANIICLLLSWSFRLLHLKYIYIYISEKFQTKKSHTDNLYKQTEVLFKIISFSLF